MMPFGLPGWVFNGAKFLLGLGVAIMVHEFGHFIAARWARIRVLQFSIGFWPRLFGFRRGHTEYLIQALPIGGYVRMAGEEWTEASPPKPYELMAKPWWKRIVVYAAGVTMNLLLAWILFVAVLASGLDIKTYPAVVGDLEASSPAALAGLRAGDRVTAVGGTPVANWVELLDALDAAGQAKPAALTVRGAGGARTVRLPLGADPGLVPRVDAVVGAVMPGLPADRAGLKAGDRIVRIGGRPVRQWSDLSPLINRARDHEVPVDVVRGRDRVTVRMTPRWDEVHRRAMIGIEVAAPLTILRRLGAGECARAATGEIGNIMRTAGKAIWSVLSGRAAFKDVMGGPVMIVRMGVMKAEQGWRDLVYFLGVINVQLVLINLLPIPSLDGSMIILAGLEGISRRRFAYAVYEKLAYAGATLLLALMAYATFVDLHR